MKPEVPAFRADGSLMDLANPLAADIDWPEAAAGLSKLARWNGRPAGAAFSVAQHSVMGADAIFAETGDAIAAAYFVLHDVHEYLLGEIPRDTVAIVEHFAGRRSGIQLALNTARATIDAAVFDKARIIPLAYAPQRPIVEAMDDRMARAEAIALFGPQAAVKWGDKGLPAPKLVGAIRPWGAMKAEEAWLQRLERFLGIKARP